MKPRLIPLGGSNWLSVFQTIVVGCWQGGVSQSLRACSRLGPCTSDAEGGGEGGTGRGDRRDGGPEVGEGGTGRGDRRDGGPEVGEGGTGRGDRRWGRGGRGEGAGGTGDRRWGKGGRAMRSRVWGQRKDGGAGQGDGGGAQVDL